jgi:5-hydroxyisourate hydrolase-like protein (transthyretin family)
MKALVMALILALIVWLPGCATVSMSSMNNRDIANISISETDMIPIKNPMAVHSIEIFDLAKNERIEADVLSLSSKQIRSRLTSTRTFISVEQRDSSGRFSYIGTGGKVARGTYRITFDYVNYMNKSIQLSEVQSAIGRIGVGLRVTATLDTENNDIDISGLLPIGLAAKDRKVSGQIEYYVYGMSNDKISVAAPTPKTLDLSSIQEAFEAAAKTKVMFNLDETILEPYLIGLARVSSRDADKIGEIATERLAK